jgi:hypothetical protein
MTTTLQDVIAAARAGDTKRAQLLAAGVVRENPDDANAWYLLSQLVDSDARRAAYLSKALALDPNHARASIEFNALPADLTADLAPAAKISAAALPAVEMPAEPAAATTLVSVPAAAFPPGAVAGDEAIVTVAVAGAADAAGAVAEGTAPVVVATAAPELIGVDSPLMSTGSDVPGLGQPLSPEAVHVGATAGAAEAAAVSAEYSRPQAPRPAPRPAAGRPVAAPAERRNGGNGALTILFALLVILTLVVLGFLIYLLFF